MATAVRCGFSRPAGGHATWGMLAAYIDHHARLAAAAFSQTINWASHIRSGVQGEGSPNHVSRRAMTSGAPRAMSM